MALQDANDKNISAEESSNDMGSFDKLQQEFDAMISTEKPPTLDEPDEIDDILMDHKNGQEFEEAPARFAKTTVEPPCSDSEEPIIEKAASEVPGATSEETPLKKVLLNENTLSDVSGQQGPERGQFQQKFDAPISTKKPPTFARPADIDDILIDQKHDQKYGQKFEEAPARPAKTTVEPPCFDPEERIFEKPASEEQSATNEKTPLKNILQGENNLSDANDQQGRESIYSVVLTSAIVLAVLVGIYWLATSSYQLPDVAAVVQK